MAKPQRPPVPSAQPAQQVTVTQQLRKGPLPLPSELAEYDRLIPGAADRIIAMAEREQAHRMNQEDMIHRADIRNRDEILQAQRDTGRGAFRSDMLGQAFGAAIALACVVGAVYTAVIGAHPTVSIALVGLPVAAIIKAIRAMPSKK